MIKENQPNKLSDDIKEEYSEWEEYGRISLSAMKDFTETISKLSGELRGWVASLVVVSSAVVGAVAAVRRIEVENNPLVLIALVLLVICILWGLVHIKNLLESQILYLDKSHTDFQAKVTKVREAQLSYFSNQTTKALENVKKVKVEVIDTLNQDKPTLVHKDWQITSIFWLFAISMLILVCSFIIKS